MRWSSLPCGGVLALDADRTSLGVELELEIITSDGLTWGMWVLPSSGQLLAVVAAGEA